VGPLATSRPGRGAVRARVVAVVCLGAAWPAGCGSSTGGSKTTTAPAPAPTAAISILEPADGQQLKATQTSSGALSARAGIRGRARPGSSIFLSAGCRPQRCHAQASAGADGGWAATMTLSVPRAARFVTIDANAQRDVIADGSAVATVELVEPARAPAPVTARRRSHSASGGSASRTRAPARRTLPRDVLVIGDSLALGMAEPLEAALPDWRVRTDGRIGRGLAEGMRILGEQSSPPAILAFSLFTNDDPDNTRALEAAVRTTATRPGSCVVWSTVVRPPLHGVSYETANTLLRGLANDPELALGLQVVDWAAEVAQSPSLVASSDGVHATPAGYRARAQLYAAAIRSCAGVG
jgi:hypothetical protein